MDALIQTKTQYAGVTMWNSWAELYLINQVLTKHKVEGIIELGTMAGGLSMFLFDLAGWLEIPFVTIDKEDRREVKEGYVFRQWDILDGPKTIKYLQDMLSCDVFFLYCDNGNKPKEVDLYAPSLRLGSVLGVHDWPKEINEMNMPLELSARHWKPIFLQECKELKTKQRFWLRDA